MLDFEVILMTNATTEQVIFFINKYRGLGATKISIFYDGDEVFSIPDACSELTICDNLFWNDRQISNSSSVEEKQRAVYNYAYSKSSCAWVFCVDIDEFIFYNGNFGDIIAVTPSHVNAIRFPTIEAAFRTNQDLNENFGAVLFRRSYNRYLAAVLPHVVYPGLGGFFIRGLLGHAIGKQMTRSNIPHLEINIHHAEIEGKKIHSYSVSDFLPGMDVPLAHFDAISLKEWCRKWNRRLETGNTREMGKKREKQQEIFRLYSSSRREKELFTRLYALNPWQERVLRTLSLLVEKPDYF
ncbi:hypothetical protein [Methylobacterium mesophilicum]